jgi:hypothetical protein
MRRVIVVTMVAAALAVGAWWLLGLSAGGTEELPIPGEGSRIVVEVLNATRIDGLARETTRLLRRRGIDVVYFGTARTGPLDSTLIVVRRGDTTQANVIRDALGVGSIVVEPESRLLLDVSVFLGRDAAEMLRLNP